MPQRQPSSANARRKVEAMRAQQKLRARKRRLTIAGTATAAAAGIAALTVAYWPASSSAANASPPATVLASAGQLTGAPVDGIQSGGTEQVAFHIHAHLQIYVNGAQRLVPYGIGIIGPYQMAATQDGSPFVNGGSAFYWLHTHDESGILHMEAPAAFTFTLGDFFDMWKQPLSTTQVGPAKGPVTVLVDGKQVTGDPRQVTLSAHTVVQLDVGTVVAFQPYSFPDGL